MKYRDFDIRIHPSLTEWVLRRGGVVIHMVETQAKARQWIDRYWHESWGRERARAEGRERL
jgi:hypothetical protein